MKYRRANIFDIPLIFELMSECAVSGEFSDVFILRTGCVSLLYMLLSSLILERFFLRKNILRYEWKIILGMHDKELGFFKRSWNQAGLNLELLAISPTFRKTGIGSAVMQQMIFDLPRGVHLNVHCTKYARVMQHILKRHRFKRNTKFGVPQLEEYTFVK